MSRVCTICHVTKSLDDFHNMKGGKYGKHTQCKPCRTMRRASNIKKRPVSGTKKCPRCKNTLPIACYNSDSQAFDGLNTYCKDCRKEAYNEKANTLEGFISILFKDLVYRAKYKKLTVGITRDDILELYKKQDGKCALTGAQMTYSRTLGSGRWNNSSKNISVDRINSRGNYTLDNIQLVCSLANTIKWDSDQDDFFEMCKMITEHHYGVKIRQPVEMIFHDRF